jgi:hypothetical protein
MSRISAGAIIAQSYRFAFGNFFGVLAIIWLPLALEFFGLYLLAAPYIHAVATLLAQLPHAGDGNQLPPQFTNAVQSLSRYAILFVIAGLFLRAVMMLGITQEALGVRKGLPFVYFAIGKDVWRLFGAYFIFYVLLEIAIIAIVFVVTIPGVIIGGIVAVIWGDQLSHSFASGAGVLVVLGILAFALLIYAGIFYFALRLGFLLTPVVVVEKKIDIARIWNLAKGNVWRMFLVCLAILMPAMIVYALVLMAVLLHAGWPELASLTHNTTPEVASAHMAAFFSVLFGEWFVLVPFVVIFAVLLYGLTGSAMAFSYRALVPKPEA